MIQQSYALLGNYIEKTKTSSKRYMCSHVHSSNSQDVETTQMSVNR